MIRRYEEVKKTLGGAGFFNVEEPKVSIKEPSFIFISSSLLPETESIPSNEVWNWTEEEAIPVVFTYEKHNGREPYKVSGHEHYDVKSEKKDSEGNIIEERYIEIKTKTKRQYGDRLIDFDLSDDEYQVAVEKGDKYWLYIVYGVRAENQVILCIRNPAKRFLFEKKRRNNKKSTALL